MGKPWVFTNYYSPSFDADKGEACARFTDKNFIIPDDIFDEDEFLVGELNPEILDIEVF